MDQGWTLGEFVPGHAGNVEPVPSSSIDRHLSDCTFRVIGTQPPPRLPSQAGTTQIEHEPSNHAPAAEMKSKTITEAQFLSLLQKVLPETTRDLKLAEAILDRMAKEIRLIRSVERFEAFCADGSLPDLEPATVANLQNDLGATFGDENVVVTPEENGEAVAVEIKLPDRTMNSRLKVQSPDAPLEEEELKARFVPFPVALPEDPDLLWVLARREDLVPDEAMRSLASIEEEFWASKGGLKLQKDRVERTFAEFIANVPAGMLGDSGLKRHYKDPEARQTLRRLPPVQQDKAHAG